MTALSTKKLMSCVDAAIVILRCAKVRQLKRQGRRERDALKILGPHAYRFLGRWRRWKKASAANVLVNFLRAGLSVREFYGTGVSFSASNWSNVARNFRSKTLRVQGLLRARNARTRARLDMMTLQWDLEIADRDDEEARRRHAAERAAAEEEERFVRLHGPRGHNAASPKSAGGRSDGFAAADFGGGASTPKSLAEHRIAVRAERNARQIDQLDAPPCG